jgi:hypothetical protein
MQTLSRQELEDREAFIGLDRFEYPPDMNKVASKGVSVHRLIAEGWVTIGTRPGDYGREGLVITEKGWIEFGD